MNEEYVMRPGDTFIADECGCSFTVESGPSDEHMARQAPRCCCGHEMHKEGANPDRQYAAISGGYDNRLDTAQGSGAPHSMPD